MARTDLTIQEIAITGLAPTFAAAETDGNMWLGRGNEFLVVKNASGSSINVTLDATGLFKGLALTDPVIAVPAAGERWIGPFEKGAFAQSSDGKVYVDYSAVASVTVAVVRLPL